MTIYRFEKEEIIEKVRKIFPSTKVGVKFSSNFLEIIVFNDKKTASSSEQYAKLEELAKKLGYEKRVK